MNKSVAKQELHELLPWHVNGTLVGDEREAVRALLASDLEANRQARELKLLRAALADEPIMATNMAMNLRRLNARLDPPRRATPRWFVPLSLAATALLAIAGGFALFLAGERAGRFQTLSTPDALVAAPGRTLIRVTVDPGTDAPQLVALAGDRQARVVEGPSAYGVAVLEVPAAEAGPVLARLRADPRLRFVAPVAE